MYLSVFKEHSPQQVSAELIRQSTKNVLSNLGAGSPNRLLYVPNIDKGGGCEAQSAVARNAETVGAFSALYRLRDRVFPESEFGRELIRIHETYSFEAYKLLFTNSRLRAQLLEMLESSRPVVDSLLNGDGQAHLDRDFIRKVEAYVKGVAQRANPEMRADLMKVLQEADLWAYEGKPVSEAWKELGRTQPQNRSRITVRPQ
jgi:hypothetical protein